MSAVPMLAGVGLMMVCCSSSSAAMMMGGGEETPAAAAGAGAGAGAGAAAATLPSGQYVKLVHTVGQDTSAAGNDDDKNKILNLAELEVFAKGGTTSLAAGKTVEAANFHPAGPLGNLVDGNFTNFGHTLGRTPDDFDAMTVDLGSVQEIEKIKITNRTSCCQKRAIGVKAVILGADGTTVIKETAAITTEAATYTFTFPGTAWA
jgi:hypothetical protein